MCSTPLKVLSKVQCANYAGALGVCVLKEHQVIRNTIRYMCIYQQTTNPVKADRKSQANRLVAGKYISVLFVVEGVGKGVNCGKANVENVLNVKNVNVCEQKCQQIVLETKMLPCDLIVNNNLVPLCISSV